MQGIRRLVYAVQSVAVLLCAWPAFSLPYDSTKLEPKPVYGQEIRVISYLLNHHHYRKAKLNDSLSSVILNTYIDKLDNSKTYFLRTDIESFEPYRFALDDDIQNADVDLAYAIYNTFRKRYLERMAYAMQVINTATFDYSLDEYYDVDREDKPWSNSVEEMDEIWRKIIKYQALSLKLAGKTDEAIREELRKRYRRYIKNTLQFNSEDIFSLYANAVAESYDPHTNYLSPKVSSAFKQSMSLSLEGVGARLQNDNDYTKIIEIIPGGPAQKSNQLHINDRIVGVAQGTDGEMVDIIGWRVIDVVGLIKGPKGTVVRLQLLPAKAGLNGGTTHEVQLVREKIKLEDMAAQKKIVTHTSSGGPRKYGVISLPSFYMDFDAYARGEADYRSTTADVKKLIDSLQQEGVDGIVIDLRNNGGGALSEAIDLTGLFVKQGPIVQTRDTRNRIKIGSDEDKNTYFKEPLVVLTNRFSASASEIFAGAIQDYGRGIVVGEPTYGKGTVQTIIDLSQFIDTDEEVGKLKVTFQKFYRITGSSTQNKGVVPDVEFPSAYGRNQYSESAQPGALPWDEIDSVAFKRTDDISEKTIDALRVAYNHRVVYDSSLQKYIREMDHLRKKSQQTKVSLNEQKRREQMQQDSVMQSDSEPTLQAGSEPPPPSEPLQQLRDEPLREAILLVDELVDRQVG